MLYALPGHESLARVSTLSVRPGEEVGLWPASDVGIVLIAVERCSVEVDGQPVALQARQRKFIHGKKEVHVSASKGSPVSFFAINVVHASQALTFDNMMLAPGEESEDASDQGVTLLIALTPLALRDSKDQAGEDEPSRPGAETTIELQRGQFAWLNSGIHRLHNAGASDAKFVLVEW
jgi:hypothetical protein